MRIALGEIVQETGTFTPSRMGRDAFEAYGLYQGSELLEKLPGGNQKFFFVHNKQFHF